MTMSRGLGLLLIVLGLVVLLVAPQAQLCVTDFQHTAACRGGGTVVLKVVGVLLVASAALVLARSGAANDRSGDSTR
jgi:drug/metabolite transporter (DMT)-like permease